MRIVAIPVKNKLEWTAPLVEHLLLHDEIDELWIYDNGSTHKTEDWIANRRRIDKRLHRIEAPKMPLYHMWNTMIEIANEKSDKCDLAILNNDIRLPPFAIRDMSRLMREGDFCITSVDPTLAALYTKGIGWWNSERAQPSPIEPYCEQVGLGFRVGWAFVLAAEFWKGEEYAIHPDYDVYYGDDDLYRRAMARGGRVCIARGIGSDHAEGQSGWDMNKWDADKRLYEKLWL
jgi:glycosyltransferase involved in cell wall biosynthesis